MRITQALVLAGGEGTRLRPLTHVIPKPLVLVKGRPLVEYTLALLKKFGVNRVLLSVGYKANEIAEYFGDGSRHGLEIDYVIEKEPLGTAGPLKLACELLDENFFCLNADEVTDLDLRELAEFHLRKHALATIFLYEVRDVSGFGVAELKGEKVARFVEKPRAEDASSRLINGGRYAFNKKIVEFVGEGKQSLERVVFPKLAEKRLLHAFVPKKRVYWHTVNTVDELKELEAELDGGSLRWLEEIVFRLHSK